MSLLELLLSLAVISLLFRSYSHHRYQRRMLDWLSGPLDAPLPKASGIWGEFVSRMTSRIQIRKQEKSELAAALEQFRSALEALPDGVVFMDTQQNILWMNHLAEKLLSLSQVHDIGQPIEHIVREPEFVAYLQQGDFAEPLTFHPARRDEACYMITVINYGYDRALMTIRDLTRLEKLEKVRRDFVANVSHELKTPLTVISGFIETLQSHHQTLSVEKRQRFLDLTLAQAHQMNRLVQDLLTLSSLEASATFVDESDVLVSDLIAEAIDAAEGISLGRHQISSNIPSDLCLRGSESALRSIFGNLINNAVNYTPDGGQISVVWQETPLEGELRVIDNGIGIPAEHLPRLTERFYRVDQGRSRDKGGTGLGLAIVKHALSRHQGYLEIQSQLNLGSTFIAHFPASRIQHHAP